jgi:hypothetical protein
VRICPRPSLSIVILHAQVAELETHKRIQEFRAAQLGLCAALAPAGPADPMGKRGTALGSSAIKPRLREG